MRLGGRIQRLEQQIAPQAAAQMWLVPVHANEPEEAALARQGVAPGPQDVVVLITHYGEERGSDGRNV